MSHKDRPIMDPPPKCSFEQVFEKILNQSKNEIGGITTTGGVKFSAKAKYTQKGEPYISLPHNNRIYSCCWGNTNNHMGKEGQRIGQYSKPLDEWCQTSAIGTVNIKAVIDRFEGDYAVVLFGDGEIKVDIP